jgi:5'-nucleotidase
VRILVTNDDGVHAPGLFAITSALAEWARAPSDEGREVVVVAPLANHSGAAAAVGTVYEREGIPYRAVRLEGLDDVVIYGLDASPALSTIVGIRGAFGPPPDLVVSGINHGVNVGRSVLHSGTVGAVLTAAQLGVSGLAVSLRTGQEALHWGTAAAVAVGLLPTLTAAPHRTVLNLNVPSVPLAELRGVRQGRIGSAGIIRSATADPIGTGSTAQRSGDDEEGEVHLRLGSAVPALGDVTDEAPEDDASVVAAGFASLTPLLGIREDRGPAIDDLLRGALVELRGVLGLEAATD